MGEAERIKSQSKKLARLMAWLLLIGLFAVSCLRIYPHFQILIPWQSSRYGWDLRAVCTGLEAARLGQDPYEVNYIGFYLPYPLLHSYLVSPLCWTDLEPLVYGLVYSALALVAWFLLWPVLPTRWWHRVAALVAIFFSFRGFDWELMTGNIAIFELPLAALALRLVRNNKRNVLVYGRT